MCYSKMRFLQLKAKLSLQNPFLSVCNQAIQIPASGHLHLLFTYLKQIFQIQMYNSPLSTIQLPAPLTDWSPYSSKSPLTNLSAVCHQRRLLSRSASLAYPGRMERRKCVSTRCRLLKPHPVQVQSYFAGKLDIKHQSPNLRKLALQFDSKPSQESLVLLLNLAMIVMRQTF